MIRKVAAFTLVELLVVISIIVVLASIITPVAMQVGRRASVVKCGSQLGELALATELRERVIQAQLTPREAALGLLECLWAIVAGADEKLVVRRTDVTRARAPRPPRP